MASTKISFALVIFCLLIATGVSIKRPNFKPTGRIVNGFDANRNQFPYFASLTYENATHLNPSFCGGAVISHWHILTAAHCVEKYENLPSSITVDLGKHILAGNGVIVAEIEKIIPHPSYVDEFLHNDIALLKTVNKIEFSASVQPIALPRLNVGSDGDQRAVLCGFGRLNYVKDPKDRKRPVALQHHETKPLTMADCEEKYIQKYHQSNQRVSSEKALAKVQAVFDGGKVLCALNDFNSTIGGCQGDSGGPLAFKSTLIGLLSATTGCGNGYPDIYADVYEHMEWIRSEMKKLSISEQRKRRVF